MKKILFLAILAPSTAFAHAGAHTDGVLQSVIHALTEPDHLAIALGVLALGYGLYRWNRG